MRTRLIVLNTLAICVLVLLALAGAAIMEFTPIVSGSDTSGHSPDSAFGEAGSDETVLDSIIVSGTITGPSGPVEGARVTVNSFVDTHDDITDSDGYYSLSIEANEVLLFHVRPQLSD